MKRDAFTLVELGIMIIIVALLAAIAIPNILRSSKQEKEKRFKVKEEYHGKSHFRILLDKEIGKKYLSDGEGGLIRIK